MKVIPVKYLGMLVLASLLGELLHSCTASWENPPEVKNDESEIMLRMALKNDISTSGLLIKLYVFSNEGTGDYLLTDSLPQVVSGLTRLKLNPADLNKKNYRFLFVATPETKQEIQVGSADNAPFSFGTSWQKAAVRMSADSMSTDNYYGITDIPGNEILERGSVDGELTRLVGQMVFCFYKAGPGGVAKPVDDPQVGSVMDRVSSIDITYEGVPRQITFDSGNQPVAQPGSKSVLKQTVRFSLTKDGQKVILPQADVPVETADSIPGGAILKGMCLLPSQQNVRVSMLFHYYDTTPVCENQNGEHTHGAECYTPQTMPLSLPQRADAAGLSVLPDHFTINNARLPCNRIIDILHTSGIEIDTVWN